MSILFKIRIYRSMSFLFQMLVRIQVKYRVKVAGTL
jgi:hypothetical protein